MYRFPRILVTSALACTLLITGCTAQQWQTTKDVLAVTVLLPIVILATVPPPVTTTCRTMGHGATTYTVCSTYQ